MYEQNEREKHINNTTELQHISSPPGLPSISRPCKGAVREEDLGVENRNIMIGSIDEIV